MVAKKLSSVAEFAVFPFDMCLIGTRFTSSFFVTNSLILSQNCVVLAMVNPLTGPDHEVAGWFHAHLTRTFVCLLRAFIALGLGEGIGVVVFFVVQFFVWKKCWSSLVKLF